MGAVFHWVKVKMVCYATEDEDVLHDVMVTLTGLQDDEEEAFDVDISEGLHGNPIVVMDANLTHSKECERLFRNLGKDVIETVAGELEQRIDDDCVLYMRIDKQKAVGGEYAISHSGDVISITAKVASHPAKKEIAVRNAGEFFKKIVLSLQGPASQ